MPKGASARSMRLACVAMALCAGAAASADTRALYRWTDEQGRVQYSDKPPVKFKGEVTRIDVDLDSNTRPAATPRAPLVPPDVMRDVVPAPPDVAKARREKREKLDAAVRQARGKVDAARAALAGGGDVQDDEHQVVQRRYAKAPPNKANCRVEKDGLGKAVAVCPALAPGDAYYERQRSLEEAVKKAEADLAAAEYDYRRGVD